MKFLAVDLGASSGRTIVGTLDGEGISLEETHRFENGPVLRDGYKRWDVPRLLEEIKAGIARSGPVDGIGLDTWGVDYGYLDADGELLDLPCSYRDDRHVNVPEKVYERIDKERLYSITGTQEMSINTIFQVYADKLQRPELFARARKLLLMPDLLRYLLTGEMCAEYTICSTSEFLDARKRTWSQEILDALEIPRELFPDVSMPGVPAGTYEGTPVYLVGGHDTASAVAAVPATGDGDWAYLSSGTWSLIGAELREPVLTPEASAASFTNEGGIGGTIRFLKNVNGLWLIQECRRIWAEQGNELDFAEIAGAANESPYPGLIDPNDPRFMAPDDMVRVMLANPGFAGLPGSRGIGFAMGYDGRALPAFYQWQNLHEGDYVIGMEPATCHAGSREDWKRRNEMAWLAHGESRGYHLEFSALIGEAELAEAIDGIS